MQTDHWLGRCFLGALTVGVVAVTLATWSCSSNGGNNDAGTDAVADGDPADIAPVPDRGAPDLSEDDKPKIKQIIPADGPSDGGRKGSIRVTLVGENFGPNMTVYVAGGQAIITTVAYTSAASVAFDMPKNPYGPPYDQPAKVAVQVRVDNQPSNMIDFQYTVARQMSEDFSGAVVTASPMAFRSFPSEPIEGMVYVAGVTDAASTAPANLLVQVGIGKVGEDPALDYSFKWSDAEFVGDGDKRDPPLDAKYDLFAGQVTPVLAQQYDIAYRFSQDGGQSWVYADGKEEDRAYDPADAVKLSVQEPPPGFCMVNNDCITSKYRITCKVEADWKQNHCVECLQDADCQAGKFSLGPTCDEEFCTCAVDDDCKTNLNGRGCVSQGSYCGCESDDHCDWANGEVCALDEANQIQICFPGG